MSGFYPLRRKQRLRVREIARQAFIDAKAIYDDAVDISARRIRQDFGTGIIAAILISIAIRLAVALIIYWINNRILTPMENDGEFIKGEPGA